jgi:hypothetical protein
VSPVAVATSTAASEPEAMPVTSAPALPTTQAAQVPTTVPQATRAADSQSDVSAWWCAGPVLLGLVLLGMRLVSTKGSRVQL